MEEIIETIGVMRWQEENGYMKRDWIQFEQSESCMSNSSNIPLHYSEMVDVECREKMVAWCYQVVDFCKFRRETVEISMSLLDRFLATPEGMTARNNREVFQLTSMAALYTAIKINEPMAMDPKVVAKLSHGAFSPKEIEAAESTLLHALSWRVNPPTSMAFVRMLMDIIPEEALCKDLRNAALDLTSLQTELAVGNYSLITVQPSVVAIASLMNTLESLRLSEEIIGYVGYILSEALQIEYSSELVMEVQKVLYESVSNNLIQEIAVCDDQHVSSNSPKHSSEMMSIDASPRSTTK